MGNIIRMRKNVTDELDSLSQKMEVFRDDIEKASEARRMVLWYLTLSTFFLSSSFIAYVWIVMDRKEQKVLFSILSFVAGHLTLWLGRKSANAFYSWRINRKRQGLDSLIAKKKSLLETVKETEVFKVAKEILDKYDEEIPNTEAVSTTQSGQLKSSIQPVGTTVSYPTSQLRSLNAPHAKSFNNSQSESSAKEVPLLRPRIQPVRPFQKESATFIDKIVDYFFGDGPSQRYALICINCHGHNGMALPAEYDYLAFVCFICGHFNPARKFRPVKLPTVPGSPAHTTSKANLQTDSQGFSTTMQDTDKEPEKTTEKEVKPDDSFDDLSEEHVELF